MAGTENEKIRGTPDEPVPVHEVGGKGGTSKYDDQREVTYTKGKEPVNQKSPIGGSSK